MRDCYDLLVIGAGIHGAGVAQAAAARGWSVLVVDKGEAASGTSSRSSKLIHGGLRYLETLQIRLVHECLRERALLLRNAPELVSLQRFYIPVYENSRRGPFWIRLGLSLYALLGGLGREARFSTIPRDQWKQLNGLETQGLRQVFCYRDGQTDDAALTRAVLASAQSLGAELLFHEAVASVSADGEHYRVTLESGNAMSARAVVNAAGPWLNRVAELVVPEVPRIPVDLVQGTHIVLDFPAPSGCFYLESPDDGRAVFTLPWKGRTMVGTTETRCEGPPDECRPLDQEVTYLLRVFNRHFPDRGATEEHIVHSTAGLRVLPRAESPNAVANKLPRETLFAVVGDKPAYLAIYGGKLTSYRATAEKVTHRLAPYLPARAPVADTKKLKLKPV